MLWVGSVDELVAGGVVAAGRPAARRSAVTAGRWAGRTGPRPADRAPGSFRGAITFTKPRRRGADPSEDRLLNDLAAQAGLVIELQRQAAELRAAAQADRRRARTRPAGASSATSTTAPSSGWSPSRSSLQDVRAPRRRPATTDVAAASRPRPPAARPGAAGVAGDGPRDPPRHPHRGRPRARRRLPRRACPAPVRLDVCLDRRLTADVEAAAYFVVSEALTNAAKHARAYLVIVRGSDRRPAAADRGDRRRPRWRRPRRGSGLQGLADRLATLDGRLTWTARQGGGTRLGRRSRARDPRRRRRPVPRGNGARSCTRPGSTSPARPATLPSCSTSSAATRPTPPSSTSACRRYAAEGIEAAVEIRRTSPRRRADAALPTRRDPLTPCA